VTAAEPRVAPIPKEDWDDEMRAALAHAFPEPVVERLLSTEPGAMEMPGAIATFMRHPGLAGPFLAYNQMLLGKTAALAPRDRELVVLRVAWRTRSRYEWYQHVRLAPRVDITEEELAAIADGPGAAFWSPRDANLLTATDQLIDAYRVDDTVWARLAGELDPRQLVELVFVVGTYTGLAMAFNSFGLQLDAELDDIVTQHPQFDQFEE
jgi:alkylhydroperoxidase family enzyme